MVRKKTRQFSWFSVCKCMLSTLVNVLKFIDGGKGLHLDWKKKSCIFIYSNETFLQDVQQFFWEINML